MSTPGGQSHTPKPGYTAVAQEIVQTAHDRWRHELQLVRPDSRRARNREDAAALGYRGGRGRNLAPHGPWPYTLNLGQEARRCQPILKRAERARERVWAAAPAAHANAVSSTRPSVTSSHRTSSVP